LEFHPLEIQFQANFFISIPNRMIWVFVLFLLFSCSNSQFPYQNSTCLFGDNQGDCFVLFEWTVFTNKINISISGLGQNWLGIGFQEDGTPNSMDNSDIWVCIFNSNGTVSVLDIWALHQPPSNSEPPNDVDIGGTYDALNGSVGGMQNSSWSTCWFSRLLNTGDKYDFPLATRTGTIQMIAAAGMTNGFVYHQGNTNQVHIVIIPGTGAPTPSPTTTTSSPVQSSSNNSSRAGLIFAICIGIIIIIIGLGNVIVAVLVWRKRKQTKHIATNDSQPLLSENH